MGHFRPLFLYFCLFYLNVQLADKICRCWYSNRRSQVLKATTRPTEPPPVPDWPAMLSRQHIVSWFVTILSNEAATTFSFQNAVASSEEEAKKAAKKPSSSKTARAPEVSNPTPLEFELSSRHFLEFVRFEKKWTWQLLFAKISRLTLLRFHHVVGGSTGPGFSLMRFDLHEKKNGKNDTTFIRNKCCHLTEPHWIIMNVFLSPKSWKMPRCFRFIWDLVARLLNAGFRLYKEPAVVELLLHSSE